MPYRVDYSASQPQDRGEWGVRLILSVFGFFCFFSLLVHTFWPEGREVLVKLLFPGDAKAVWSAFGDFSRELDQGLPLRFAAQNFCSGLMSNGY